MHTVRELFRQCAGAVSEATGSPWVFIGALMVVLAWAGTGPIFGFSDTWQLVINTGTTVVTFLMIFLVQNTQNRDSRAIHLKLDELLRAVEGARTGMVNVELMTDDELAKLQLQFQRLQGGAVSPAKKPGDPPERKRRTGGGRGQAARGAGRRAAHVAAG